MAPQSSLDLSIIIILTEGQRHFAEPCLRSIFGSPSRCQFEVLLVDNACSEDTVGFVRSRFPAVRWIHNEVPHSYAHNNNLGMAHAQGRYILLLNLDTVVGEGALDALVQFMDQHSEAGACTAQLLNPDGSIQFSCRRFPTPLAVLARGTPLRKIYPFSAIHARYVMADWDHKDVRAVDWALGACLLVRREVVKQVGGMDERFVQYYEEIDWCYRIKRGGWQIYYVPEAQVMHHYQRASAAGLNRSTWFHARSIVRYLWKHRLNTA